MPLKDPPKSGHSHGRSRGRLLRPPDLVLGPFTSSSTAPALASNDGSDFLVQCDYGVIFATGDFSGVEVGQAGLPKDWTPLLLGFPYRADGNVPLRLRKNGMTGTLRLLGWDLEHYSDEEIDALIAVLQMYSAGAGSSGPSAWPGPAASALNDADANPVTTRVGANLLVWDANTATWKRGAGSSSDTDGLNAAVGAEIARAWGYAYDVATGAWDRVRGYGNSTDALATLALNAGSGIFPGTVAFPYVANDRTGTLDRLRQPDSRAAASAVGSAVSLNTTGIKVSYTVGANKNAFLYAATLFNLSAVGGQRVNLEIVRGATTYVVHTITLGAAIGQSNFIVPGGGPIPLLAGDVVQLNVVAAMATTADLYLGLTVDRFTY